MSEFFVTALEQVGPTLFSLRHLLLCHLFVSNFSVNRKGLFRPVPICDGAFLSSMYPPRTNSSQTTAITACF